MMQRVYCSKGGRFEVTVTVTAPKPVVQAVWIAVLALLMVCST